MDKLLSDTDIKELMGHALEQADLAQMAAEVPVGAVIARLNEGIEIISRAHNEVEQKGSAVAHAEILAIERASEQIGTWRLENCILCVTLEPCTMCAGAISLSRVPQVVFGAFDQQLGAYGSRYDISESIKDGAAPRIISSVREDECVKVLQGFFASKR